MGSVRPALVVELTRRFVVFQAPSCCSVGCALCVDDAAEWSIPDRRAILQAERVLIESGNLLIYFEYSLGSFKLLLLNLVSQFGAGRGLLVAVNLHAIFRHFQLQLRRFQIGLGGVDGTWTASHTARQGHVKTVLGFFQIFL